MPEGLDTIPKGFVVPTRYWHRLDDGRVQCDVCPRFCRLNEGQRGFCFVRARQSDAVVLTAYGRSSGFAVDPIEKKPLYHFLPGTPVLSFGTTGCNLGCRFCQNWDISKSREIDTLGEPASPAAITEAAARVGCRAVAFTYNDPTIFHEYAIDVAGACHDRGLKAIAVTAGYVCPEPRAEFYRHIDAANVDLKGFTERFYERLCLGHLAPVLDTLRYLRHETSVWLELTTLLIPGENDSDSEIDALSRWIAAELGTDVPIHFTAFHPSFRLTYRPATPPSKVIRAREIARGNGLRYVYTGNVEDTDGQATPCHACGQTLVARSGYAITQWNLLSSGRCLFCGTQCRGVFERMPGHWERPPVRVSMRDGNPGGGTGFAPFAPLG